MIRFIDLFCGVGGFHVGLEQAKGFKCVCSNEWDKYAGQVYQERFPNTPFSGKDIRAINADELPDFDLLCAGFPCQAFSIAGKRKGFNETRGTLFFEIARIIKAKRPSMVLLENVKGLLSHEKGKTFAVILDTLQELGYWVEWEVLNSKNFGVPQNRERVFIIGHLRGTSGGAIFPLGQSNQRDTECSGTNKEISRTVSARFRKGVGNTESRIIDVLVNVPQAQRIHSIDELAVTLKGQGGGMGAKTGLYAIPCLTPDRANKRQNGRRFKEDGDPSFTLTGQDVHGVAINSGIRRLTPVECERLQGFPDGWTKGLSDTQRYKCMGNAVTTNVITAIGEAILKANESLPVKGEVE